MDINIHKKIATMSLISQAKLQSILNECGSKKDFIIDPMLIKPLERICGVKWLRQQGIDKIYKMDPSLNINSQSNRVYMIPACIHKYKCVLDHISSACSYSPELESKTTFFHIIIVPKVLSSYESLLESRGLYDTVVLHAYSWELIALDEGLLSFELPFLYRKTFVEHNNELLSSVAMSLWSLTHVLGKPDFILSVGKLSANVVDIMEIYNESYSPSSSSECYTHQDIGAMIVIDRDQDYAAPLLTPVTYSALLHEIFNFNSGQVSLNVKETKYKKGRLFFKAESNDDDTKIPTVTLDSSVDPIYNNIKYRHFSEVLSILSLKAKQLKSEDVKGKDLQEIKEFVATKLPQMAALKQCLVNHVLACETIISELSDKFENLKTTEIDMINNRNKKTNFTFVDDLFGTDIHIYNSLRLLCLMSLTQGISYDEYNTIVTKYLHAFGHKHLYIFDNLINAGLLVKPSVPKININLQNIKNISDKLPRWQSDFQISANKLKLIPGESDSSNKSHSSYVFNGSYVPLISALCNILLSSETLNDCLSKLSSLNDLKIGGELLEKLRKGLENLDQALAKATAEGTDLEYGCKDMKIFSQLLKSDNNFGKVFPLRPKSIFIYIIGGLTYAEIAACNVIENITGSQIILASDSLITGSDLIAAAW